MPSISVTSATPARLFQLTAFSKPVTIFNEGPNPIRVVYNLAETAAASVGEQFLQGEGRDIEPDEAHIAYAIGIGGSATVQVTPRDTNFTTVG